MKNQCLHLCRSRRYCAFERKEKSLPNQNGSPLRERMCDDPALRLLLHMDCLFVVDCSLTFNHL